MLELDPNYNERKHAQFSFCGLDYQFNGDHANKSLTTSIQEPHCWSIEVISDRGWYFMHSYCLHCSLHPFFHAQVNRPPGYWPV